MQIEAEARHNAQCEANRRAKDAQLIRADAALDAAIANPAPFRQPVTLSINFNYQSAEEIDAQLGWYPDSDSDGDDVYEIVESIPGQTTFGIRDPTTGRCTWKDNRRRAFTHLQMNGGFLYQAEESGKTGPWFKAVHVDSFETFVAIARRGCDLR